MAEISIKAETLFYLGVFNFTNSYFLALIVVAVFVSLSFWFKKYIAIILLFVMLSNWLGLLPGTGSLGLTHEIYHHGESKHVLVPLLRAPTSDLNFTIALAIIAVFSVNLLGAMAVGIKTHVGKFFNLSNPIYTFVGFLELVSEFVKIISFSFRLFGNVFAGEVLLIIIGFLGPYFLPLTF